jgi:hypothetical protein
MVTKGKIKQCRRVATRYDKLAANYLAFIQLASIRLGLRVNDSTPYTAAVVEGPTEHGSASWHDRSLAALTTRR